MKFGSVDDPGNIDFTLPPDHPDTKRVLETNKSDNPLEVYVGCAKWNRADLKGFYPRGTKDELVHYATQFNSIELNATFYRIFPSDTFSKWYDKTPDGYYLCTYMYMYIDKFMCVSFIYFIIFKCFILGVTTLERSMDS